MTRKKGDKSTSRLLVTEQDHDGDFDRALHTIQDGVECLDESILYTNFSSPRNSNLLNDKINYQTIDDP